MAKLVFHVDVNSAFLSWEAARRVANGEPDICLIFLFDSSLTPARQSVLSRLSGTTGMRSARAERETLAGQYVGVAYDYRFSCTL